MEFKTYFAVGWLCCPDGRPVNFCTTIQAMKGDEKCRGTSVTPTLPLRPHVQAKCGGTARSLLNHVWQNEKGTSPLSPDVISSCAVALCYRWLAKMLMAGGHGWFVCDRHLPVVCSVCDIRIFFPRPAKTNTTNQISCLAAPILIPLILNQLDSLSTRDGGSCPSALFIYNFPISRCLASLPRYVPYKCRKIHS